MVATCCSKLDSNSVERSFAFCRKTRSRSRISCASSLRSPAVIRPSVWAWLVIKVSVLTCDRSSEFFCFRRRQPVRCQIQYAVHDLAALLGAAHKNQVLHSAEQIDNGSLFGCIRTGVAIQEQ